MTLRKLRSRQGMTLVETLTTLAVFAILSVALVVGTTAAWKVYQKAVVAGEARTLESTITQSLSGELRYSQNVNTDGTVVSFDSDAFGTKVSVISSSGRIKIGNDTKSYDLLPEKTYTNGLEADAKVTYADGFFTVELTITHELLEEGRKTTFTVRALNG